MRKVVPHLSAALFLGAALAAGPAGAQQAHQEGEHWHPSPYGAEDQAGAANLLTPELVRAAAGLVTEGRVYSLGIEVNRTTPAFPPRSISVTTFSPGQSGGKTLGSNKGSYNDDVVSGWLGIGTQIDGLGHIGIDNVYYNGHRAEDFVGPAGLTRLGIEHVPPLVGRGVLLDVAAHRGVERMEPGDVITAADVEAAMARQGVEIREGDIVLMHTGWLDLLGRDDALFGSQEPGIGVEAARFLAERRVVAVGADTWGLEAVPHEEEGTFFPVHQELLAKNGIYILENVDTRELARDGVDEFLFVLGQPKLTGAVQMIVNPVAIR